MSIIRRVTVFSVAAFLVLNINLYTRESKGLTIKEVIANCLKTNYGIRSSQAAKKISEGVLQEARGRFDYNFNLTLSQRHREKSVKEIESNITDYNFSIGKLLGNGTVIGLNVINQRLDYPSSGEPVNYSEVNVTFEIPFLRNSGRKAVRADLDASRLNFDSEKLSYRNQVRKSVRDVLIMYWKYVEEAMILKERITAEKRAERLIRESRELIKRGEVAPSELIAYQGNLGNKVSTRIAQEQRLFETKLLLGKIMGMKPGLSSRLSAPMDKLPEISGMDAGKLDEINSTRGMEVVLKRRKDYIALDKSVSAADILLKAAEANRKSDLKMVLKTGYNGADTGKGASGFLGATGKNIKGLNFSAGLSYNWLTGNNYRRGVRKQKFYNLKRLILRRDEMRIDISIECMKYINRVKGLIKQYRYIRQSTDNYLKALKNEQIKYKMNMSTQLSIIETEENYMEAAIREIGIKRELAEAITFLKYTVGDLGIFSEDGNYILRNGDIVKLNIESFTRDIKKQY